MKKGIAVITAVIVIGMSGLALAQMNDKGSGMMMDKGDKGGMMGKGGMMMGMHGMMMKMGEMMNKIAVATSDGGIVVIAGDKMTKYDKDLSVVKEVELKSNMEAMQKMMSGMMAKCPMMGKGMMGGMGKDKDGDDDATEAAAKPADTIDHASHH